MGDLEEDLRQEERARGPGPKIPTMVTKEEQGKIMKMHQNLGHPNILAFIRMLRAGRV